MEKNSRFRPLYPVGERKPDPKVGFTPKNPEKARERTIALNNRPSFIPKPPPTPKKCPICGTDADDYRNETGQEMLLPGGNPFICAKCGNTEWNI